MQTINGAQSAVLGRILSFANRQLTPAEQYAYNGILELIEELNQTLSDMRDPRMRENIERMVGYLEKRAKRILQSSSTGN